MLCGEPVVFQIERDFRGAPRRQVYANFSDIVLETPSWDSVPSSNVVGTLCNFVLHSQPAAEAGYYQAALLELRGESWLLERFLLDPSTLYFSSSELFMAFTRVGSSWNTNR